MPRKDARPRRTIKHPPTVLFVEHGGYPFDVMIALGLDDEELIRTVEEYAEITDDDRSNLRIDTDKGERGRAVYLDSGPTVIALPSWTGSPVSYARLAHEIFHAVELLLVRKLGVQLREDTAEVFAYAVEHLTRAALTQLALPPSKRHRPPLGDAVE